VPEENSLMGTYTIPGVYLHEVQMPLMQPLATGVPAFLGYAFRGPSTPTAISTWLQFQTLFGSMPLTSLEKGYLAAAVRGFFENGGRACYVVPLDNSITPQIALGSALTSLETIPEIDLMCMPDAMQDVESAHSLQQQLIDWCDRGKERFAILDSPLSLGLDHMASEWANLDGLNAALYFPWVGVTGTEGAGLRMVPPCGHIAGVFASTDRERGFFAVPANRALEGVLDVAVKLSDEAQLAGDPFGVVNCIRAFPGRGIRVWGARTLSAELAWRFVNVRRLFLTFHRWLNIVMSTMLFEPNTPALWARIRRTISGYLDDLYRAGGLAGLSPNQAYFVHCDASTTPPQLRDNGQVVARIGLAPVAPIEFIVVTLVFGAGEVLIGGESKPSEKEQ